MAVFPSSTSLATLKLYVDNLADPIVTDLELGTILARYAIVDVNDTLPSGVWRDFNYYGAAAEAWRIKASRAAKYVSVSADGQQMSFNQVREACETQYKYYMDLYTTGSFTIGDKS